jgi:hypothetical protein
VRAACCRSGLVSAIGSAFPYLSLGQRQFSVRYDGSAGDRQRKVPDIMSLGPHLKRSSIDEQPNAHGLRPCTRAASDPAGSAFYHFRVGRSPEPPDVASILIPDPELVEVREDEREDRRRFAVSVPMIESNWKPLQLLTPILVVEPSPTILNCSLSSPQKRIDVANAS